MRSIRLVGSLVLGISLVQLLLTVIVAVLALFSGLSAAPGAFLRGLLILALSVLVASISSSCSLQMQQLKVFTQSNIQTIRLVWTALVLVLALAAIIAALIAPPLSTLWILLEVALFSVRPAIIRLSSP